MSSQTRIVILKMRTIIYTCIFIFLVLVLGVLLYLMFGRPEQETGSSGSSAPAVSAASGSNAANVSGSSTAAVSGTGTSLYQPGCYSAVLKLGDHSVNVDVTVNTDRIESVSLSELPDGITDSYPLLEPAMEDLNEKIVTTQSTEYLTYDEKMQYTQTALTEAIKTALEKASGE
ncbi:MAG: hypothetical protein PUG60_13585 [Lachnospiraceae bacterium]|nr:hypothetical protein [Lachnospiraceae bacterium]MDY4970574.1 hypothetical protein [Lachnospiraceae bacterium]